jgi:transglutaminase-like putative cysteine protease
MKLCIAHRTVYRYREAPRRLVQTLRLTPRQEAGQQVLSWGVHGADHAVPQGDAWGNHCHTWTLERPTRQVVIEAGGVVTTVAIPWYLDKSGPDPALYLRASPLAGADAAIAELAGSASPAVSDRSEASLLDLAAQVRLALPYRTGLTHAGTTAAQALALGGGVCQDQAHVFIIDQKV